MPKVSKQCVKSVCKHCVFSHIRTEYEEILGISPYSVRIWGNTDQKNSEYGLFLRSEIIWIVSDK